MLRTTRRETLALALAVSVMVTLSLPLLSFAADPPQALGWFAAGSHPTAYEMGVDRTVALAGKSSGFIRARGDAPAEGFGTYMQNASVGAYAGKRVRLSASLKTKDVEMAALWLRADRADQQVAFDNMADRMLRGTKDWTRVFIVLDIPENAERLAYGVLLGQNKGTVWFDELKFEIVDQTVPVTGRPLVGPPTNLGFETAN